MARRGRNTSTSHQQPLPDVPTVLPEVAEVLKPLQECIKNQRVSELLRQVREVRRTSECHTINTGVANDSVLIVIRKV